MVFSVCHKLSKTPQEVLEFTFKELYYTLRYLRKADALELDTRIKLAGGKKGYDGLNSILAEEQLDLADDVDIDTDEKSESNQKILARITKIAKEG